MSTDPAPPTAPAVPPVTLSAPPAAAAALAPDAVHFAVAHPTRRAILRTLATGGETLAVQTLSARLHVPDTLMGKHCRILRKAGLIHSVPPPDGDTRKSCYQFPAALLTRDAPGRPVLDFGTVALRL